MESAENNIRYYFVDYENVHQSGLNGIEKLNSYDKVIIFYTANAETLTFTLYEKLIKCKAEIKSYKVQCGGKNALDFQLSSYVGYVLGKKTVSGCNIISSDKGYEYIISFWKEKNIKIKISSDIEKALQNETESPAPDAETVIPAPETETDFDKAVKPLNLSKEDRGKLCSIFYSVKNNCSGQKLQKLNQIITKHFNEENAVRYYNILKPLIKDSPDVSVPDKTETDFDNAVKHLNLSEKNRQKLFDIYIDAFKLNKTCKICTQINNEIGKVFGSAYQKKYYSALKQLIK